MSLFSIEVAVENGENVWYVCRDGRRIKGPFHSLEEAQFALDKEEKKTPPSPGHGM